MSNNFKLKITDLFDPLFGQIDVTKNDDIKVQVKRRRD